MKKLIAIILALILVMGLVACGRQVETPIANPEPTAAKELPVKVGFIYLHDEQSTYDLNFLNAAREVLFGMRILIIQTTDLKRKEQYTNVTVANAVQKYCTSVQAIQKKVMKQHQIYRKERDGEQKTTFKENAV